MSSSPRSGVDIVRDPLCGYIPFTQPTRANPTEVTEKDILNSPWVQRLRHILQLQCTWMVYPGATHMRFQHALGAMHLAGHFAEHLYDHFDQSRSKPPERNKVVEMFRLAGLLHDIGHGPFGHMMDDVYKDLGFAATNHEVVGQRIIREELGPLIEKLRRSPSGPFSEPISPDEVCELVRPTEAFGLAPLWFTAFSRILRGVFSVDRLDFLARDSYYCGTREYGTVDGDRLMRASFVTDDGRFAIHNSALSALKAFLWARVFMYQNVYYHRTVRRFEISFRPLIGDILRNTGLSDPASTSEGLKQFKGLSDTSLYGQVPTWEQAKAPERAALGSRWNSLMRRELEWKFVREVPYFAMPDMFEVRTKEYKAIIEGRLQEKLGKAMMENIVVDVPPCEIRDPRAPLGAAETMFVYDPLYESYDCWNSMRTFDEIPIRFLSCRIYARGDAFDRALDVAPGVFRESEQPETHA